MHRSVFGRGLGAQVVSALVAVALMAFCAIILDAPASRADAAETPPAPLGVATRGSSFADLHFAEQKFGINGGASTGKTLAFSSSARVTDGMYVDEGPVFAEESSWEYAEEPSVDYEAFEETPVYDTWTEPEDAYYEEPVYDEFVSSEPEVSWYEGVASAYSPECNGGTATASGIPLDWTTPTVASLWLPLGSYIEISWGGMSVVAQVTDRGPYIGGRDLDLSSGVIAAFGFDSTDAWGVRSVSYRTL